MEKNITVRKAERSDLEAVLKIYDSAKSNLGQTATKYVEDAINQNELGNVSLLVAEVDGKIVGAVKLKRKRSHIGNVGLIAVLPEYRRLGIGNLLYKVMIWIFAKEGRIKISDQMTEPNEPMQKFFEKLGFVKEGTLRKHTDSKQDVSLYAYYIDEQGIPEIPQNVSINIKLWEKNADSE
jgi:ribosomal protein S18 acetylase RimI-like enzyme